MSRAAVGWVIDKLLSDRELRIRLALDPIETVADLCLGGADLTTNEIALFCETDTTLWFLGEALQESWDRQDSLERARAAVGYAL